MGHSRAFIICCVILITIELYNFEGVTIINKIRFPYGGPFIGLFLALAIPLELPHSNVFVSYNFEANYNIPENETTFEYPPDISRSFAISRKYVYDALEFKFNSSGYPGKPCLLRTICEAAVYTLEHNGVLADILHVVLTPSTSKSEGLTQYEDAEVHGKNKQQCKKYERKCSISILGLITWLGKAM